MDNAHSSALMAKHARLDARLADERSRPFPDNAVVAAIKKQKLKLKEAIAGL